ncbi:histidine phosphatase superfamily [Xylariaceae sp. FL0016]|nr:histidine phosphatase superfamily [Xylariaceae sp. FL0016]
MALADLRNHLLSFVTPKSHSYSALPENVSQDELQRRAKAWAERHKAAVKLTLAAMIFAAIGFFIVSFARATKNSSCDTVKHGFQCGTEMSHSWGPYSPFYSVPSDISASMPAGCEVTFAQVLSRHGARDPTDSKTAMYGALLDQIHSGVTEYGKKFKFIKDYEYTLGADQLTVFGEQELVNSGIHFYNRYEKLASNITPFIRSAGQERVVQSATNWTQGFHQARLADKQPHSPDAYPYDMLVLPEDDFNNTLSPNTCTAFEEGPDTGKAAQAIWMDIFVPPITERMNNNLPGANLTDEQTIYLMDLCPFNTVAHDQGDISRFCHLFSVDEWNDYDYYQSLGKWYGYGNGSPWGSTQGVGFVNELIARLTGEAVQDHTSTNTTLDGSDSTFPLSNVLYADFSHDNDMTGIYAALGLYNGTEPLSNTTKVSPRDANGYSASWTVPFAARMYVEKMSCEGEDEQLVRVLVNDRVIPLQNCGADELGRCKLNSFVDSLSFARNGGHWDECFR